MGYKMSGFEVIGCNEIDPEMMSTYRGNHNPKYSYLEPIQTFKLRNDLPRELFELDILDGSPPCSSFSIAGSREKNWGKKKKFREGQTKQILDDLFFHYIDLAKILQPRVIIAENVKGMLMGNAKGYVKQIIGLFNVIGYDVQLFLLNAASMGVPQRRERVFFICRRKDLGFSKLRLGFHEKSICSREAIEGCLPDKIKEKIAPRFEQYWKIAKPGQTIGQAAGVEGKWFGYRKINPNLPCFTLASAAKDKMYHWEEWRALYTSEWARISSFPTDYKFKSESLGKYQMGMSVPPLMIHKISQQIAKQWFGRRASPNNAEGM